jgi:hypothetical protein
MVVVVGGQTVCTYDKEEEIVKTIAMGMLCAALLSLGATGGNDQGFPTRIKLTRTTTNANAFVKTKITEKEIIARCASDHSVDPARLKLFFVGGDVAVVDIVSSNITCLVATVTGDFATNVAALVFSGTDSNNVKVVAFSPFTSLGEGSLPADFVGTLYITGTEFVPSNAPTAVTLKGTIQGGSVSNTTVYTGTISIGGKPFTLPPG